MLVMEKISFGALSTSTEQEGSKMLDTPVVGKILEKDFFSNIFEPQGGVPPTVLSGVGTCVPNQIL